MCIKWPFLAQFRSKKDIYFFIFKLLYVKLNNKPKRQVENDNDDDVHIYRDAMTHNFLEVNLLKQSP